MSTWRDAMDQLAFQAGQAVGVYATRDPSAVPGLVASDDEGCLLVGMPVQITRLMAGPNMEVPLTLITAAPSDLRAVDWLLDHLDSFCAFSGARNPVIGPTEIGTNTYPSVTATVSLAVKTQGDGT